MGYNSHMCTNNADNTKNSAFSLTELAISVIIISLIVSAILASKSVIHNMKLVKVINDFNHYISAMHNFETQYGQLPGDFDNAYSFFGNDCDASADDCNGDGDGRIEWNADNNADESNRFWQHLYLSGLTRQHSPGDGGKAASSMRGPIDQSSFIIEVYGFYGYSNTNNLTFTYNFGWNGIITPKDAKIIDTKMDDGTASTGRLLAADGQQYATGVCTGSYKYQSPANYILTSTTPGCLLAYPYEKYE